MFVSNLQRRDIGSFTINGVTSHKKAAKPIFATAHPSSHCYHTVSL